MKVLLLLPFLPVASSYMMGGMFGGRPVVIRPGFKSGYCSPDWNEPASSRRSSQSFNRPQVDPENIRRQQQELMDRFFELAKEFNDEHSSYKGIPENDIRQQQDWVSKAFDIAQEVTTGTLSPRYEVVDMEDNFQVMLDIPGVPASSIELNVIDEPGGNRMLVVEGQRQMGVGERGHPVEFKKRFKLDSNVDSEQITAQLANGVLTVSVPKIPTKERTKRIDVVQLSDDSAQHDDSGKSASVEGNDSL